MHWVILLFLLDFHQMDYTYGNIGHLLVVTQGEGGVVLEDGGNAAPLKTANFLPVEKNISVRPRSGLESVANGYQFRFGASTRFTLEQDAILLQEGSMMIQSRKLGNELIIRSPETRTTVQGVGCILTEVGTSGGLKVVGILGRFTIRCVSSDSELPLMPGELFFHMPGSRGFGEKVNLNLEKLIKSSYLLSGFPNTKTFVETLEVTSELQKESIGKIYAAEVGDSKKPTSFEILPTKQLENQNIDSSELRNEDAPNMTDPLTELLGRPPIRLSGNFVPVEPEKKDKEEDERPFPSRLLRKN